MEIPLKIIFHGLEPSSTLETRIQEKVRGLEKFHSHIIGGRVVVERLQKHSQQGDLYTVHLEITVPGADIAVTRERDADVYIALREAFDAVRRRLEDRERMDRGETKAHEPQIRGQIVRIFPEEGFGFIQSEEGREVYFNRDNCVHPAFDHLDIGDTVHFLVVEGGDGPQARRVTKKESDEKRGGPQEESALA